MQCYLSSSLSLKFVQKDEVRQYKRVYLYGKIYMSTPYSFSMSYNCWFLDVTDGTVQYCCANDLMIIRCGYEYSSGSIFVHCG